MVMPRPSGRGIFTGTVASRWIDPAVGRPAPWWTTVGTRCQSAEDPLDGGRRTVDFDDSPDEAAYRAQVRQLLEQHAGELLHLAPGEEAPDARTHEAELRRTERVLAEAGLVGITWPREYGGEGGAPGEEGDRREGGHHAPRPR